MKIVHLLPALTKGGAERVAVDLANHADASGHETTVIAAYPVDPALLRDRLRPGIDVRYVSKARAGVARNYAGGLIWVRRNAGWLAEQDVVHCHLNYATLLGSLIWLQRRLTGARRPAVVETEHAVGMPIPRAKRWLAARLARQRDALALMAEDPFWTAFRRRHRKMGVWTVLNGVSFPRPATEEERAAYRAHIGLPERSGRVIGTIGALRPERRTERYVPIFAAIARALDEEVHLLIGGDGPAMPAVREAARASGLAERIHLPGLVPDPAVALATIDLYLTLNIGPVTGVAALEAAAAGVPVLAMQFRDDYEASEDDWIWSSRDPDEIARRTVALLRDPAALHRLGERQRAYVHAHHSVEAMAQSYYRLYREAIAVAAGEPLPEASARTEIR